MENAANFLSNPQTLAFLKQIFNYVTQNGVIETLRQLGQLMNAVGFFPSQNQEKQLFDENKRPDGTLNFNSFLNVLNQHSETAGPPKNNALGQFQMFDRNGDGKIDAQDLMAAISGFSGATGVEPQHAERIVEQHTGSTPQQLQQQGGSINYVDLAAQLASKFLK